LLGDGLIARRGGGLAHVDRHLLIHRQGEEALGPFELVRDQVGGDTMIRDVEEADVPAHIANLQGDVVVGARVGAGAALQVDDGNGIQRGGW